MPDILSVPVPNGTAALAWSGRQAAISTILFYNTDTVNTVWLGSLSNITPAGSGTIPILPNGTFSGDPTVNWYVTGSAAGIVPLVVVPNGQGYFLGITAGMGNLVIPSVQSPNFVEGISGWQIRKDGSVEFNNGVFRGFIVGGALYIYSGVPGLANPPIFSVSGDTTDPYGNTISPGIWSGQYGGSAQAGLNVTGTVGELSLPVTGVSMSVQPRVASGISGSGAIFEMEGPAESAAGKIDYLRQTFDSYSVAGAGAQWFVSYIDANGGNNTLIFGNYQGLALYAVSQINAVAPGTGTSVTVPAVPETWHTMPAFNTNFSHGSPVPAYKLYPDHTAGLTGQVVVNSGTTSGTVVTLPTSAYFPASLKKFPLAISGGTPAATANAQVTINTSGDIILSAGPTGAGYSFSLDNIRYPLDYL